MNKCFTEVTNIEELRKRYRELLKKYHPDNENGSVEITPEINVEYDRLFVDLSRSEHKDCHSSTYEKTKKMRHLKRL